MYTDWTWTLPEMDMKEVRFYPGLNENVIWEGHGRAAHKW